MGLLCDVYQNIKKNKKKYRVKRASNRMKNGIQQHAIIKSLRLNSFMEAFPANKTLTRLNFKQRKKLKRRRDKRKKSGDEGEENLIPEIY